MTNKSAKSRWSPDPGLVASALADAELVIGNAGGLPGGGRLGDQPESFEDRRREDSLFGAAPYEVGDSPSAIRWRDFTVRDELIINLFETRSAEPTVLLLTQPSPTLLRHVRLRDFAASWLIALGHWALAAGAAVHVGDDQPALAGRGVGQARWISERIGRAFSETTYETIEQLPHWATVFVVASVESTPEAARNVGSRLSGRFGRIYSLVPLEDCLTTSRRAIRPDGHGAFLTAPAGALTKTAVENAIAAGEDAGVTVVPIVVEATARDYRAMLARLATGGPP